MIRKTMNRRTARLLLSTLLVWSASSAVAQVVPETVRFQAYITDSSGVPLNGEYTLLLEFYSEPGSEAVVLWGSTVEREINNGSVSIVLGDEENPLDYGVFASDGPIYLQLSVNGEAQEPRFEVAAVPFAMWAANVRSDEEIRAQLEDSLLPLGCSVLVRATPFLS